MIMAPGGVSTQLTGAFHFGWSPDWAGAAMPMPAPMPMPMPAWGLDCIAAASLAPKWTDFKNSRKAGFAAATTSESPRILKNQEAPSRGITATTVRFVGPAIS